MGAKPSSFRKSGGFFNGVDGVFENYQWTDEFNGEPFKPGKIKLEGGKVIDRPHTLNLFISVRLDGAEEATTTTLKAAGNFDDYEVSDDGYTVTAADGGECNLSGKSAAGKFLASLTEAGFPEERLSDDPNSINYQPVIGTRIRLVQRVDADRTKEFGKRKDKKSGKEFDRTDLVVDQVHELPAEKATVKAGPKAAKAAPAVAAKKGAKVAAAVDNTEAVKTLATETLVNVVDEAGGSIAKQKLSVRLLLALKGHNLREDVRKYVFNDDNLDALAEEGYITYDRSTGTISKAA